MIRCCSKNSDGNFTPNGNYALDRVSSSTTSSTLEPSAFALMDIGLAASAGFTQFKTRRTAPHMEKAK